MDRDKMIKVLFSWFEDDEYTWDEVDDVTTNPYRWKAESLVNTLLAPVFEKAERWDAYQTDLINEKTHTERFIKLMDAEEGELRADAERWRKVVEIAKRIWMDDPCEDCPVEKRCDPCNSLCGQAYSVVEALKEAT